MLNDLDITEEKIQKLYEKLKIEAEAGGYHLNPDVSFTKQLVESLIVNEKRYGYPACPCRLASGNKEDDLDIICPCDYRDADILEYGACYCGLYVSEKVLKGQIQIQSIPERRPPEGERKKAKIAAKKFSGPLPYPVWRCKVCGYLCARESPPEVCPICRAKKERFERFM
ncbi:MAG: ferredoxin:glutaredoxin reductase [candidate division WOR-3 bacterium]|nr:ferredoxin:glutaredoxin reductase [candidate division WOR-3 bacterium]